MKINSYDLKINTYRTKKIIIKNELIQANWWCSCSFHGSSRAPIFSFQLPWASTVSSFRASHFSFLHMIFFLKGLLLCETADCRGWWKDSSVFVCNQFIFVNVCIRSEITSWLRETQSERTTPSPTHIYHIHIVSRVFFISITCPDYTFHAWPQTSS